MDRILTSNENVNFSCVTTGTPQAVISWLRNNNVLISSNSLSDGGVPVVISNSVMGNCTITDPPSQCVSSSTLQILNTRAVDSGEYTCIASNEVGRDTAIFNVIVNGTSVYIAGVTLVLIQDGILQKNYTVVQHYLRIYPYFSKKKSICIWQNFILCIIVLYFLSHSFSCNHSSTSRCKC